MLEDTVDGRATLTVLGCAGSVPGPESASSSYLVRHGDFSLILDLGAGAVGPLQRFVRPQDVSAAFFSHPHADHIGDVWGLIYLRSRFGASQSLPVYGPPTVTEAIRSRGVVDPYVSFEPVPERLGGWTVRTAEGVHNPENWSIRLGDSLCYSGDTEPCQALDALADGCAVLLAEGSGFDADRPPGHLSAGDAGRLARRSGAKLLVLTHLRAWHDHNALLAEASAACDCPVVLATPGLRVALP
jgi:ribonuclease BN (tRNA processing enzyme)